jgi:heavy metal sensor kinase
VIGTVRARLTLWYVCALAAALIVVAGLTYVLLARALYTRIDATIAGVADIATTSLANDLAEGQDTHDAARSTAAELASSDQMLAIYDPAGRLLAEDGRDDDLTVTLPPVDTIPSGDLLFMTVVEALDDDDRHRLGFRRVRIDPSGTEYIVAVGSSLEPTDEELESLREILLYLGPLALALAGLGGWLLARRTLSPVVAMAERARRIGVQNLGERLPVANPGDELGRLADTFNELLGRLEAALTQQRHFMADASHELRTPVTTARTAANVALQKPHREEREYRETLAIVEQQAARLSRIVDDMFTLARADAGSYPVRRLPLYLDEVVDEVARGARVLAAARNIRIEVDAEGAAPFDGDEELVRRLVGNLLDNAARHAPNGTTVHVVLRRAGNAYRLDVVDHGAGIPPQSQPHIFERFYRVDPSRVRNGGGGAGLGLALARWIARTHGGDVVLSESSERGTRFTVELPLR